MSRLILVADDDPLILRLVEELLVRADWRVRGVANGREAAELIESLKPDLILSDLDMPEMGGLELVRLVVKRYPGLPIVVFTGQGGEEDAVRCFRSGAADYVSKSKLAQELIEVVQRLLKDREAIQDHADSSGEWGDTLAPARESATDESTTRDEASGEDKPTPAKSGKTRSPSLEDEYIIRKRRLTDNSQDASTAADPEENFKITPSRLQTLRRQVVRLERWSELVRSVKSNKRRHERRLLGEMVVIIPMDEETGEPRFDKQRQSFCKDVSVSGFSLLHHLPLEGKRWLVLLAPNGPRPMSVECEVVRERRVVLGMLEIGLRFTKRSDGTRIKRMDLGRESSRD